MNNIRSNIYLICLTAAIMMLGSCNVSRYLSDNEYLVKKSKVLIEDQNFTNGDSELIYNLESFIVQKPNRDYFLIPREWIYFRNQEEFESNSKKRGIVKEAERPVLHIDSDMVRTAEQMEKYLRFSKGFYNAKVYPEAFLSNKRAEVHYHVYTQEGYTVRSKEYYSKDKRVLKIIQQHDRNSLVNQGTPVDEAIFDAEKSRMVKLLQDRGFANFAKNHIDFQADSSDMQMDVFITILPPATDSIHRKYKIGQIKVYPDFRGEINDSYQNSRIVDSIEYSFDSENYFIKPRTLDRVIEMEENELYQKKLIDNTYSGLANLGTYRFINISSSVSESNDTTINYNVFLTPILKTWAIDGSLDLFYTYLGQNSINRLGLSANSSISNINAFGGGEKFSFGVETTGEINLSELNFSNYSAKAQTNLRYPTLLDPAKIFSTIFKRFPQKLGETKYNTLKNKTKTDIGLSYSFISQVQQYQTNGVNGSFTYEWKPNQRYAYFYTPIAINSSTSRVEETFRENFLDPNPLLARSFDKIFITGFLFQEFIYINQSPVFSTGFSWGMNFAVEQSGGEILAANLLYNSLTNSDDEWALNFGGNNQFDFSKYLRTSIDLHGKQILSGKHEIAGRFKVGVAAPFSLQGDAAIPFIKQYYVGGANSLRAWQTRELGPGGYSEQFLNPGSNTQAFFQTGDFVLETSLEYRFPIYYVFDGGLFIDAGNVWTLSENDSREDSQLTSNFYNQIAVGYGFGIRLNLDFIIIRFDFGYKLRYPFQHPDYGDKYWRTPELNWEYISNPNITIGINYPF